MKLVWLTDIHLTTKGRKLFGYDPEYRLRQAIEYIRTFHFDADFCVLTGDLVNDGDSESYELLNEIISELQIPYLALAGNHDNRKRMKRILSFPESTDPEFIQFSINHNGYRLIGLDTLHPGHSHGVLCDQRLAWLDRELAKDKTTSTLIFSHHHPAKLHLPMQDDEILLNGDTLLDRLCAASNVKHLFFGHVHRPVSGSFRGLGFTALQSVALQAPLPYPKWDWNSFTPALESPALGIIHASTTSLVTHFHSFCQPEDGWEKPR